MQIDYERRFGGVARLYGEEGARRLANSHVCVVGVGGVGSWAVEALARTDVRRLTLVDLDNVAESNTNRQIQALGNEYGRAKIDVLKDRIALINPRCRVTTVEDFVDEDNVAELIPKDAAVLDCIDQVRAKAALITLCRRRGQLIVTSGAAGGRIEPGRIKTGDLGRIAGDPLLASVRYRLRKACGFPKADVKSAKLPPAFGVVAVYSDEPVRKPLAGACPVDPQSQGLACSGYGSGVVVTATMGMTAASLVLNRLALAES